MRRALFPLLTLALSLTVAAGQPQDLAVNLDARVVTLKQGTKLSEALAAIEKQTGVKVRDKRTDKSEELTKRGFERNPVWEVVDALAGDAAAGVDLYGEHGALSLVSRKAPPPPVSYHQAFRTTVKRIVLTRDFGGGDYCTIHLETTWEPRMVPFLVDVGAATVVFAPDAGGKTLKGQQPARGKTQLEGQPAADFDIRVPAPARSSPWLQELRGTLKVTLATRMLDFTLANLQPVPPQDGVKVTLKQVNVDNTKWTIRVIVDNPQGTPTFESFQDWLFHNRISLTNGKHRWESRESAIERRDASQAVVEYYFLLKDCTLAKSKPADWTLHYRTPGRMVEAEVPYRFEKVPLP